MTTTTEAPKAQPIGYKLLLMSWDKSDPTRAYLEEEIDEQDPDCAKAYVEAFNEAELDDPIGCFAVIRPVFESTPAALTAESEDERPAASDGQIASLKRTVTRRVAQLEGGIA